MTKEGVRNFLAYSLLGLVVVLGLWQGASKVFAQVAPPATTICIIIPSLCQPNASATADIWASGGGQTDIGKGVAGGEIQVVGGTGVTIYWKGSPACTIKNDTTGSGISSNCESNTVYTAVSSVSNTFSITATSGGSSKADTIKVIGTTSQQNITFIKNSNRSLVRPGEDIQYTITIVGGQ